ncbi:GNAT family N-acetyltransferase [Virgibacillus necropolis]|uniref:GNAT family N-acetyltransferase n=1 Tax=Virgibacillus necropolis TaxID=163877 RepID=A0A221MF39_9BACI|nr:GNAT family N-acetyltransferase [Virgibacillus necropolis]ASN06220.1 GNAT family N-acetyltransferase [Virgibacillus necropolis]
MTNKNVTDLEKQLIIRNITPDDLDEIAALSNKCFGPDISFKRKHFVSQLKTFPEGQICIEYEGKIVGNASSLIINYCGDNHSYKEVSDGGFIRNHNPDGINLYGIEVGVDPAYRGMKIGQRLYEARRNICRMFNLKSIIIGGRIPFYHKHADQLSAEEYVRKVINGDIYDPVLTFQSKNGFVLHSIIPDYLPDDHESMKYATSMEWQNPDFATK